MLTLLDGVRWDGEPVPGERSHALLAVLALAAPRPVGVTDLVERLWSDEEPAHPDKALQVLVSRTRSRTSPDSVVHGASGYRLGLREDEVDALRVRHLVREAREAHAAGDLDVARHAAGDALAVPVTTAVDDGPLAELAVDVRREQAIAGRLLGQVLLARGDAAGALPLLEQALAVDPADEDRMADVLKAEAAVRGVPAALTRYAAYVEQSLDASGAEPGNALRLLHAELLARDAPVREGLKYDAAPLVGRDDAVAEVRGLLDSARVVSIVGAGGLGKTRLAHLVGRLAPQPVVHFVELAGVTAGEGVLRKVANDLGVRDSVVTRGSQARGTDLRGRLAEQLAAVPTLVILDNCEHLIEAVADLVAFLVATTDRTSVLTTSRAPLGIAAERVYQLAQLDEDQSVELFEQRARAARPGVRLDRAEVQPLVARLDGLPLAIELAAAKVRAMSVTEISRRLGDRFALLAGGDRSAPDRHRTLEAVIDWSWNLLRAEDQVALRRLSAFPDGFALDGAEALLGRDPLPSLAELVDQSLAVVREADQLRYRFLETVREYGQMQLSEAGESADTAAALRAWAVARARELAGRLYSPDQVAVMNETRAEVGNLAGVMRAALDDGDVPAMLPLVALLTGFWSIEGDHLTVLGLSPAVLDVLDRVGIPPDADADELRNVLGQMTVNEAIFTGRARPSALQWMRELGPGPGDRASAMSRLLLMVYGSTEKPDVEAMHRLTEDDDRAVAMAALQWLSQSQENLGELAAARESAERALALCDDSDGPWSRALTESMLAGLASQSGDWAGSVAHARSSLRTMELLGATQDILQLRAVIALADLSAGRLDEARTALEAVAGHPDAERTFGWTVGLVGLAELALAEGDVDRGLELYRRTVAISYEQQVGDLPFKPELMPWVLFAEASALVAYVVHGRADQAADLAADLRTKLAMLTADERIDIPVTGCLLFALGGYDLVTGGDASSAVRALALAYRFGYQRSLPTMAWSNGERLAEQYAPGRLAEALAVYADQLPTDLRQEAVDVTAA